MPFATDLVVSSFGRELDVPVHVRLCLVKQWHPFEVSRERPH